jgi:UDP-N-acetylmuramyl pentapeptide synthase
VEDIKIENENWEFDIKLIASTRNLSVASLKTGVDILTNIKWNKILVMEDILELWKDAQKIHKNLWKEIWQKQINSIYFVWANYSNSFLEWLMEVYFEGNFAIDWITKNDIKKDSTIIFLWKKTNIYLKSFLWKSGETHLEKKLEEARNKEKEDIKELIKESSE